MRQFDIHDYAETGSLDPKNRIARYHSMDRSIPC